MEGHAAAWLAIRGNIAEGETRKGARPNKASLYAVTWCALDHCGGKPWEQSTGPKTIAGKATVSVNAYKGGTRSLLRQLAKLLK